MLVELLDLMAGDVGRPGVERHLTEQHSDDAVGVSEREIGLMQDHRDGLAVAVGEVGQQHHDLFGGPRISAETGSSARITEARWA